MIVFPAVDILRGSCVRLYRGDYERATEYSRDPVAVAEQFVREGAEALHMVDLDGAREGSPENAELVLDVRERVDVPLQVGGGLRRTEDVARYLAAGVDRVIIGTASAESPEWLASLLERFGTDRVAAGVDVEEEEVMVRGWLEGSGATVEEALEELRSLGVETVIYTDVTRDGTLGRPNVEGARRVVEAGFRTLAAGGISSPEHLRALRRAGVHGAVVGSALYEGEMSLAEARDAASGSDGPHAGPEASPGSEPASSSRATGAGGRGPDCDAAGDGEG